MRLQRLATYRLIRMLRAVLPVIVVILVGIPARNYWISRINANSPEPKVVPPAADVSVQTNELSFTRKENGRVVFHLTSKEHLLFKDNRSTFREVTVVISGEKTGDFDRIISGNEGVYDKDTGDIHFTGNVNAQLDATTAAHTEQLIYNNHDRVITSPVRTHVEQPGEMNGDADRLEYLMAPELLRLAGDVGMQMSNGEALHADVGEFHKKENWTAVSGDVYLEASNGWLRGATGHAELTPGTYRPTIVTIDGDVRSESRNAETSDILKTRSSNLVSVLSPGSSVQRAAIQRLFAKGDVQAEQTSKGELQTITGAEVDALLDDHGHVDTMEVRQPTAPYAKVITTTLPDSGAPNAKNEGSDRKLISQMIHIKSDGVVTNPDRSVTNATTVTTTLNSKLESGDSMTITGSAFQIVQSETRKGAASTSKVKFDTKARAKLESDSGKKISSADTTHVEFDGKTNELQSLKQDGNFQFEEGARSGSADHANITDGGKRTVLTGNFKFKEGTRTANASQAVITDNGDKMDLSGGMSFRDGLRHGSAGHAFFENGGDKVSLDTAAKVVDEDKKSEVQARTIHFNQKTNELEATDDVTTISTAQQDEVIIKAGHAKSDGDVMRYDRNAELWSGKTTYIHAARLIPDGKNGFRAEGTKASLVYSQMEGMRAQAETMVYNDEKKIATYTGNVHATKDDKGNPMILDSGDMTLVMYPADSPDSRTNQNGKLKQLVANVRVSVTQGARKGTGDHLVYDYATDHMTLTSDKGSPPVRVEDPAQGTFSGTNVQWSSATGNITVSDDQGGKSTLTPKAK